MNLARTDEQLILAENLRRLLDEENEFERRRARLGGPLPDRLALWPLLAELGVIGAALTEEHGGFAGDARTIAVVMAELGRSLAVEPYLASAVIAGRILQQWRDAPAREKLLQEVIEGQRLCIAAIAGADPFAAPSLRATRTGDVVHLQGFIPCVRHADVAHSFLVHASESTSPDTQFLFLVSRHMPGLRIDSYRLMDASGAADLVFADARIPSSAAFSFDHPVPEIVKDAVEWGILGLVSEVTGIVDMLNGATFSYLGSRKQFGVPIGSFQALQHRAADMFIAAEELGAVADQLIDAFAGGPSAQRSALVSAAKVVADTGGRRIGHEAVQLHGGMGVSDELNISHYARRLAVIRAELGSADVHRLRFAAA